MLMWTIKLFLALSKFKEDCRVLTNIMSLIRDNSVTTQYLWFFRRKV